MTRVKVVTDSTADIPLHLLKAHNISVVPLNVHFGSEVFKDQIELSSERFFEKLQSSPVKPRTSQPSPAEFAEVYTRLGQEGFAVVSMHLSAQLSGTYQSARIAAGMVSTQVAVVDSKMASMALGLRVLEVAREAARGADFEQVASIAEESLERTGVYFMVDTLDYLYANGRIGRAAHLLGSLLNMKPILTLQDGVVTPFEKVRGKNKAVARIVEILGETIPKGKRVTIAVVHGNAQAAAEALARDIAVNLNVSEMIVSSLGAVIGTHVGPGVLAAAYLIER